MSVCVRLSVCVSGACEAPACTCVSVGLDNASIVLCACCVRWMRLRVALRVCLRARDMSQFPCQPDTQSTMAGLFKKKPKTETPTAAGDLTIRAYRRATKVCLWSCACVLLCSQPLFVSS